MMIKKITHIALALAIVAIPATTFAKKKKEAKKEQETVLVENEVKIKEMDLPITNPVAQLYGEWNIEEINKGEAVYLPKNSRAYLFFDVPAAKLYGSTGVNAINADYTVNGNKFAVKNIITTHKDAYNYSRLESDIKKYLSEATTVALVKAGDIEYMEIKNRHRDVVMKLSRQNLDFMNGPFVVKAINGVNVKYCDIRLVNDVEMNSVTITSGANIINGVMTVDPTKEFAVEYEDLLSSHNQWRYIDTETRLLIALEETTFCRKNEYDEVELYRLERNERGKMEPKTLVVLEKIDNI